MRFCVGTLGINARRKVHAEAGRMRSYWSADGSLDGSRAHAAPFLQPSHLLRVQALRASLSSPSLLNTAGYSQAVDHGASFPTLPLPLVHLRQQVEERLLGVGNVAVRRPAQELELAHHQLALLELDVEKRRKKKNKTQKKQSANLALEVMQTRHPGCMEEQPQPGWGVEILFLLCYIHTRIC